MTVAEPVCKTCSDSHIMNEKGWMCTRCPVPCHKCSTKPGYGPFCAKTPCECSCHQRDEDFKVGTKCLVKTDIWREYVIRNCLNWSTSLGQSPQPVMIIGVSEPHKGMVQLASPMYWWKTSELVIVK